IKEYQQHGEAASANPIAMEREWQRIQQITALYEPKDCFNFDETEFFPFALPDCGLATQQMSEKKRDKFWISVGVASNATDSEKLPLFFIGKSIQPHTFKGRTPEQLKLYYHNNTKAWMTKILFKECVFIFCYYVILNLNNVPGGFKSLMSR
ncbi:hypothetical protein AN958_05925, partial [Leucoagaricus sp. SymC.cos]